MNRVSLVALLAVLSAACSHLPPLPQPVAPLPAVRIDPPLPPREANFALSLAVPVSELVSLLRDQLTLPSAPDWQLVTAPGKSPEVEIRYEAELLPPQIALQANTVSLSLQVAYFGSFRARLHTPFGWVRLTKNTKWGDAERRGLIEVQIQAALELSPDYRVHSQSTLHEVKLTAPPIDELCAGGAFKVCVPAETAAGPIHRELERRVRERVEAGLRKVDEQVAERASLTRLAQHMWEQLSGSSRTLPSGETLRFDPRTLSLSYPLLVADQIMIILNIGAVPTFQSGAGGPSTALPPLVVAAPGSTRVPLSWVEPLGAISAGLTQAVRLAAADSEQVPTQIELLGPASEASRWLVALKLAREGQERTVFGHAALGFPGGDALKLSEITLTRDSEDLLSLARIERSAFLSAAEGALYRPSAALNSRVAALRGALADSVAPFPVDPLPNAQVQLLSARAAQGGVLLEVELR